MNSILKKRYQKPLNGKAPQWFREWYADEFVPYKVRMDLLLVLGCGIFIGVVVNIIS